MSGMARSTDFLRLLIAWALLLGGCAKEADVAVYSVEGTVNAVFVEEGQLLISHEEIPGLMPAMTMNFEVAGEELVETLWAGQRIRFLLEVSDGRYRVLRAEGIGGEAREPDPDPMSALPDVGARAPSFSLVDQYGDSFSSEKLGGKVVLLDFVYTRCQGPCPILTGSHVTAFGMLEPDVVERVWFASITVDPKRDRPQAMREYARKRGADLSRWSFLTGEPEDVRRVLRSYGVMSEVAAGGEEIDHLVVSFLLDADGRVATIYLGEGHDPGDLAERITSLVRAGS